MTSSSSNTQTSTPSPTSWKYRNDGIWEYNTETQIKNIEKVLDVSIDANNFKKAVGGDVFSDGTLYTVFDKNGDGALSVDELSTVIKSTTPTPAPTPAPTTTWNYGRGDSTWEYNTETQIKNIEKVLDVSIDAEKFKTAVKGDVFSDGTLYTVFDKNGDGALSVDELSTVIKSTTPTPAPTPAPTPSNKIDLSNYGNDKKYNYSLEEFAVALQTKSKTEIDRTKLRDVFTIFNDQKNISDDDIYFNLDTNGDLKLSDSEISSFVNSVKKTTPGTTDALLQEINDMKEQMNAMMQQMGEMLNMIMMMQRPITKPIGIPTFPNNMMPARFPAEPFGIMPQSFGIESFDTNSFPSFGASVPYNTGNTGSTTLADMMKSLQQLTQTTR